MVAAGEIAELQAEGGGGGGGEVGEGSRGGGGLGTTWLQCWAYGISGFRFWRSRITVVAAVVVVVGMLRTMRRNKQREGVSEDFWFFEGFIWGLGEEEEEAFGVLLNVKGLFYYIYTIGLLSLFEECF